MQDDPKEFRRFAEECLRLAERAHSVEDKAALLGMAQAWILLADQSDEEGRSAPEARPRAPE